MIRERRLATPTVTLGQTTVTELPKDAVYHTIQIQLDGSVTTAYPSGSRASDTTLAEGFPFNLISRLKLNRNGSDTVWAGSGKQLAKESLYLNGRYPFARLWFDSSTGSGTGTAQNILTKSFKGITIPANSEGIGCNNATFNDTATASVSSIINYRSVMELWLQLGVSDKSFVSLLDPRPLSSFTVEIQWANATDVSNAGATGSAGTVTIAVNCSIQSYDQDNLDTGIPFATYKRNAFQPPGIGYSSSGTQALLPKGNLWYAIMFECLGTKSGGLTSIQQPGNDIVTEIQNRVNTNYQLRDVFFRDLQAKNRNEGLIPSSPFDVLGAGPQGFAQLYYPCTGDSAKEMIPSYTLDTWDMLLSTNGLTGGGDGTTYTGNPTINLLTQELIPGKSVAPGAARGAFAGSIAATSAKPGT